MNQERMRRNSLWRWARLMSWIVASLGMVGPAFAQTAWPDFMSKVLPAPSESPVSARLPADWTLEAPAPDLSPERARWSGLWQGGFGIGWQFDAKIVIESVTSSGATVTYAAGSATQGRISERVSAEFIDDELPLRLSTGAKLVLRLRADGDMEMSVWKPDSQLLSAGALTKKPLSEIYSRRTERITTPWRVKGRVQRLEMIVYRPPGRGPFPTFVVHHGSTGDGSRPELFGQTWTSPEIARYFAAKGWQVVFPQRRGRGKSDGLYDEGFEVDRSRYSCDPELSLPGVDRATADLDVVMAALKSRDDIDHQRMLIGGVSRGGILAVAYAGARPEMFQGVINFVGGWLGDACPGSSDFNQRIFRRGAMFQKPTLWLYGERDVFYSIDHSRQNFEAFVAAGGKGSFKSYNPPSGLMGHFIHVMPDLWSSDVERFLAETTAK